MAPAGTPAACRARPGSPSSGHEWPLAARRIRSIMTPPPATPVAGPAVCSHERPHVLVVREDADAHRPARTARAAGRADRVLLALRPSGAGIVHRAVRDRARGRVARYR